MGFSPFKRFERLREFHSFPHFTMSIGQDRLLVIVTVPHSIQSVFRKNLVDLGFEGFEELMFQVNKNLTKVLGKAKEAALRVDVVQRRYPLQRSMAIIDARVEYDLRTAFSRTKQQPEKIQPQWLMATYDALSSKRSNLHVAVVAIFTYRRCEKPQSPEILDYVEATWLACKLLLDMMINGRY